MSYIASNFHCLRNRWFQHLKTKTFNGFSKLIQVLTDLSLTNLFFPQSNKSNTPLKDHPTLKFRPHNKYERMHAHTHARIRFLVFSVFPIFQIDYINILLLIYFL